MLQHIERLNEIISASGLKQLEFAKQMGVSIATQRNYEKGLRKPTFEYLQQLSAEGYDVKYLLTGERDTSKLNQDEVELLNLWRAAPLLVRHAALNALATGQKKQVSNHIGDITNSVINGGIHQGNKDEKV